MIRAKNETPISKIKRNFEPSDCEREGDEKSVVVFFLSQLGFLNLASKEREKPLGSHRNRPFICQCGVS